VDLAALASAGGAGLLVIVIGYLLVANRADRTQYEDLVDRSEARAITAETREDLARQKLDEERTRRHKAEDEAAEMRRRLRELGGG